MLAQRVIMGQTGNAPRRPIPRLLAFMPYENPQIFSESETSRLWSCSRSPSTPMCANFLDSLGSEGVCCRFRLGSDRAPFCIPLSPDPEPNLPVARLNKGRIVGKQALTMAMHNSTIVQMLTGTSDPWKCVRGECTLRSRKQCLQLGSAWESSWMTMHL